MATAAALGLEQYLDTTYRPDREYIDGELRERNVGKREHARLQALLTMWFGQNERAWSVMAYTGQRVRVSPTRVRIPDVLLATTDPQEDVFTEPPVLVVEILSPDDTFLDTQERARDYREMGVGMVWIIDPQSRTGRMCSGETWQEAAVLRVPGTAIFLDLAAILEHMSEPRPNSLP